MRRAACVLAVLFVFTSCQKQQTTTAPPSSEPSAFLMTLITDPVPPVESENTKFRVSLTDTAGKMVPGASVKLDLKMATMDMGKNEVLLAGNGSGNYEGTGKFTMSGPWKVIVTAEQSGKAVQQTFDIVAHRKQ